MRRRGISSASVIVFALAVVLMTAVATYLSASVMMNTFAARKNMEELYDRGKHEAEATLVQGVPPAVSPKAYLILHEQSGEGDRLLDILLDRQGTVTVKRADIVFDAGQCRIIRLERLGLPRDFTSYSNTTLVVHFSSGAVGEAYNKILEPDSVYPCTIDPPPRPGQYPINIRVELEEAGNRRVCGGCRNAVTPQPGEHMFSPYEAATVTASETITDGGRVYRFSHWEVFFTGFRDITIFIQNPLPLFVDDHYTVTAVYVAD